MTATESDIPELLEDGELIEGIEELIREKTMSDAEIEEFYATKTFRVVHQNNNFFIPQIKDLIDGKEILNIRPEYQRRLRWTNTQKSQLIESLLLNIPVPPIFLYESEMARYEVMDGQQRLNAIREFLSNEFKLIGLTQLRPLNGKSYSKFPPRIKRGLERSSLAAIVLLFETDQPAQDKMLVRRYVFERLNTGGRKLNHQEIRNAIFGGAFNDLIVALARDDTFTSVWEIPKYTSTDDAEYYENPARQKNTLYKTMADCQIVLRYFALLDRKYIRGSMRSILDSCMQRHLKTADSEAAALGDRFRGRLDLAFKIFDGKPFRIGTDTRRGYRLSVGLYDAVMIALDRLWLQRERLIKKKDGIQRAVTDVLEDADSRELIVGSANTAHAIASKIDLMESLLKKV